MPQETPSNQGPNEYRGMKRTQQACLNCRFKKARCSGEKPVCGYCKRLSQDCQWGRTSPNFHSAQDADVIARSNDYENLLTRVTLIETKLDNLTEMLTNYLSALQNQGQNQPTPSSLQPGIIQFTNVANSNGSDHLNATSIENAHPSIPEPKLFRILPPSEVLNSLIDLYFTRVHNQPYSFFHEDSFRQQLALHSLPEYLLLAVLASAVRFSSDLYFGEAKAEALRLYASESWRQIVSVWFRLESDPDIHICQAVTMLSIIDFTAGRRHPGWLKIGLSIRIAQDLQLMMEPSQALSFSDQEEHRRVFWSIYLLDKLCSCSQARPAALADAHCFLQLPCDDIAFRNGEWKKTLTLEQAFSTTESIPDDLSDFALVILTASVLGRCAQHSIHQNLQGESRLPPWDSKSLFATIYSALLQLEARFEVRNSISECLSRACRPDGTIDMQLAGPIIFSRALFRTCHCLLHHPLLLHQQSRVSGANPPNSFWNRALQTCKENACSLSELLRDIQASGYVATYSFMGYCATVSASIHCLYLQDPDTAIQQKASEYFQYNITFLQSLSQRWKNAEWMLLSLEKLVEQSALSATLLTHNPDWESFDSEQLEKVRVTIDYNTMSQAPEDSKQAHKSIVSCRWDPFAGMEGFGNYPATPFQQHLNGSSSQMNGSHDDALEFNVMSPFTSFFNGGGVNFGG